MACAASSRYFQLLAKTTANRTQTTITMKIIITSILGLGAFSLLSSCTFVEDRDPVTRTSSTTTTDISPPVYGSVQTKTTRTY